MKISQISISAQRTINLGNYESMQVRGECTIDLGENDLIDDARMRAINEIKEQMTDVFNAVKPKN